MLPSLSEVRTTIKEYRKQHGLTQSEAAALVNVSQSFVAKLEAGDSVPNYDAVVRLYNTLEAYGEQDTRTAQNVMQADPVTVTPNDSAEHASQLLKQHGYSQLPVVKNEQCVGSIASKALVPADPEEPVSQYMNEPFPEVPAGTPEDAVAELLQDVDAVLVQDTNGIQGIITASDLI